MTMHPVMTSIGVNMHQSPIRKFRSSRQLCFLDLLIQKTKCCYFFTHFKYDYASSNDVDWCEYAPVTHMNLGGLIKASLMIN